MDGQEYVFAELEVLISTSLKDVVHRGMIARDSLPCALVGFGWVFIVDSCQRIFRRYDYALNAV